MIGLQDPEVALITIVRRTETTIQETTIDTLRAQVRTEAQDRPAE
jgi:hypothetical protein